MKKLILFLVGTILLPVCSIGQDTTYLSIKDFQIEKNRILRSVNRTNRSNQELQKRIVRQQAVLDSLYQLLAVQRHQIITQHDSLAQLQTEQANLDGRLDTQQKSGTLLAILIPAGLSVLFLILLIWLIVLRNHTRSSQQNLEEELEKRNKRFDDHTATAAKELSAIKAQTNSSILGVEKRFDALSTELELKITNLEKIHQEEMAAHHSMHKTSLEEFEAFKAELQAGYKSISGELEKVSKDFSATIKKTKDALMELIAGRPEK